MKSLFARAVTFKEPTHWDHGSLEEADDFLEPDDEPVAIETEAKVDIEFSEPDQISADQKLKTVREEDEYLEPEDPPQLATQDDLGTPLSSDSKPDDSSGGDKSRQ